jgi:hypothetical protein
MNQNEGDHYFDVNMGIDASEKHQGSRSNANPSADDKKQKLFASLAKLKDDRKKAGRGENEGNYASKRSNNADPKKDVSMVKLNLEIKRMKIPNGEKKLNNLIESLKRVYFYDCPFISHDLNRVLTDETQPRVMQQWKLYSMQVFKNSRPIKSEENDVACSTKLKRVRKQKYQRKINDIYMKNIT